MKDFLEESFFIDSKHPDVIKFAHDHTKRSDTKSKQAIDLYYAVRDTFRYNPYRIDLRKASLKASVLVNKKQGYCVQKAILLTAGCRALAIPSALQFFIVRNHIGTGSFEKSLKTDLIIFHGGSQIYINGKWVKATPAFDKETCNKLDVDTLEFDGISDCIFQQYKRVSTCNDEFMEYIKDYGVFKDFPHELALSELQKYYPHVFDSSIPINRRTIFTHW